MTISPRSLFSVLAGALLVFTVPSASEAGDNHRAAPGNRRVAPGGIGRRAGPTGAQPPSSPFARRGANRGSQFRPNQGVTHNAPRVRSNRGQPLRHPNANTPSFGGRRGTARFGGQPGGTTIQRGAPNTFRRGGTTFRSPSSQAALQRLRGRTGTVSSFGAGVSRRGNTTVRGGTSLRGRTGVSPYGRGNPALSPLNRRRSVGTVTRHLNGGTSFVGRGRLGPTVSPLRGRALRGTTSFGLGRTRGLTGSVSHRLNRRSYRYRVSPYTRLGVNRRLSPYSYYVVAPPAYVDPYWLAPAPYFGYAVIGYGNEYAPYFHDAPVYQQPHFEAPPPAGIAPVAPHAPIQGAPLQGGPPAAGDGVDPAQAAQGPLQDAVQAFLAGKYKQAEAAFQTLLTQDANNGEAWMGLVHVYFAEDKYPDAARALMRASALGAFPQGYRFDPRPLYPDGSFDRRLQQLEVYTNNHPLHADAWLVRAYFRVALGDSAAAGVALDRLVALKRFPNVAQVLRRAALPAPPPPADADNVPGNAPVGQRQGPPGAGQ